MASLLSGYQPHFFQNVENNCDMSVFIKIITKVMITIIAEIMIRLNIKVIVLVSVEGLIRCPQEVAGELQ